MLSLFLSLLWSTPHAISKLVVFVWNFSPLDRGSHKSAQWARYTRDGRFGSKLGQIGPKWDKSGSFSDQISVYLARRAKCTEIWSEKAPDFSHLGPIWPTLEPNLPSLWTRPQWICQTVRLLVTAQCSQSGHIGDQIPTNVSQVGQIQNFFPSGENLTSISVDQEFSYKLMIRFYNLTYYGNILTTMLTR